MIQSSELIGLANNEIDGKKKSLNFRLTVANVWEAPEGETLGIHGGK